MEESIGWEGWLEFMEACFPFYVIESKLVGFRKKATKGRLYFLHVPYVRVFKVYMDEILDSF